MSLTGLLTLTEKQVHFLSDPCSSISKTTGGSQNPQDPEPPSKMEEDTHLRVTHLNKHQQGEPGPFQKARCISIT